MDLLRTWRRRLLGAAGAGVVAPIAIVAAALAVGIGGGGMGGIGSLGQTLTGPRLPAIDAENPSAAAPSAETGRLLARATRDRRSAADGTVVAAPTPAARRRAAARRRRRAARRERDNGQRQRPERPAQTPTSTPSPNPTQPPAAPTPTPSTIRRLGDQVKEVTDPVPVAGEPAGQVVDLIVETAEELPLPESAVPPAPPQLP